MLEIRGHFDGTQILFDEPCELPPNTKVIIKVLPDDKETTDWLLLGKKSFARAYSDDEPEYPLEKIKEMNPEYEGS
ncbi:MAG: hypothetical protein ACR2IA_12295 [Pyrinomonadaceae bacterium]